MPPALQSAIDRLAAATTELRAATEAVLAEVSGLAATPEAQMPTRILGPKILDLTAEGFQLTTREMLAHTRRQPAATARQTAMALLRAHTPLSLSQVAELIGRKDHETVQWAVRQTLARRETDKTFAARYAAIDSRIRLFIAVGGA